MAERKPPQAGSDSDARETPGAQKTPAAQKSAAAKRTSGPQKSGAGRKAPAKRPPNKPGRSIVNQRQTPWTLIITTVVIVVFAAGIVTYALTRNKGGGTSCGAMSGGSSTTYLNELNCAKAIQGVTFKQEPNRNHVQGNITYDATPPIGGNHSQYWADCSGTVYPEPIANENAVHMLEHGAVWITYKQGLDSADVDKLQTYVTGKDRMAMSPFPNLKSNISLQSWGYQLFVDSPTDPRIQKFIDALRYNPQTTPEYGATCSQPTFKTNPSTFGNPLWQPAA